MELAVLGPVAVRVDGAEVALGTPRQRTLVTALALSAGRPVSVDTLVELLWGDAPPPGVATTLQTYVSGLRRVLEPERQRRAPAKVLVTVAPGYALRIPVVDAERFTSAVGAVHQLVGPHGGMGVGGTGVTGAAATPLGADQLETAVARLDEALGRWRGTPYAELGDAPDAVAARARLEELRLVALEDRARAGLALGRHATVAAELDALTAAHPLRERLWALRALALTRSGRQADALDVLRTVRDVLDTELGLEPGTELRDLQTAILRQDRALEWVPPASTGALPGPGPGTGPGRGSAARDETPRAVTARPAATGPATVEAVAPWRMAGRDPQLAALRAALATARGGTSTIAVVTGEPGIGKTRLAQELAATARATGVVVAVGRGSQDDGAPPLWPWSSVLDALGLELPVTDGEDEGARFRAWEQITRQVRTAAGAAPLLVVLDDLHWADASSLRVLRLLADTVADEPLMLLCTWRPHPLPTGALADVAETLARKHALRIELAGLEPADAAQIVGELTLSQPSASQADALCARTDGNPFFLVEFARLAGERGDLAKLLAEEDPPTAVSEVIRRRLGRLSAETGAALATASVVGRSFDTRTLSKVTGIDEDDLLDVVEPAVAAGLVREEDLDRFSFAHALVRDTLYAGYSASRRARTHVRVARALAGRPARETEVAHHWLAGGPAHAAEAWHAAVAASEVTARLHAHDQTIELLRAALDRMDPDLSPEVTVQERYDVVMRLVESYRWSAQWPQLVGCVEQAVALAKRMDDVPRALRAAVATTMGALWRSAPDGEENPEVVGTLREGLARLPGKDSALRCRALLALSNELDGDRSRGERRDLVDQGLAMAVRLGEPALLIDAYQVAFMALWSPATAEQRLDWAEESLRLALATRNERAVVVSATLRVVALAELGRPAEARVAADLARRESERLRIAYGPMILDSVAAGWQAMAGRFEDCDRLLDGMRRLAVDMRLHDAEEGHTWARLAVELWRGRLEELLPVVRQLGEHPAARGLLVTCLWRAGLEEEARDYYFEHPVDLDHDEGESLLMWGMAAEAALLVGDPEVGHEAGPRLAPYAGRCCMGGSALACGPVDLYLAYAAAAAGDTAAATTHADRAAELCTEWEIPLAAKWLDQRRTSHGF